MSYPSTTSPIFLVTIKRWIAEQGEVLALFRFSRAAGSRSWEFFSCFEAFQKRLAEQCPETCIIVFSNHDLKTRGIVDEAFISHAVSTFQEHADWMLVCLEKITLGKASWYHDNPIETRGELEDELRSEFCFGKTVAIGKEPDWLEEREGLISAVVPQADGTIKTGIY
jgi:hypothetical protein